MSELPTESRPAGVCPHCGAERVRGAATCWLCGAKLGEAEFTAAAGQSPPMSFSMSAMLLVMTLACICFALLAAAPGLGIFVGVILVPVFIRTARVIKVREARGIETTAVEKWSLAIGSFFAATVMAIVVLFTAFAAFCFSCLAGYAAAGNGNDSAPVVIAFLVAGAVTLLVVYWMARWARARYRRDTGD
jgi:hypothetical protein